MFENVADVDSVLDTPGEAAADQVPHLRTESPGEHQLAGEDLGVLLPGDVATHHVIEEDPQGPDGGRASLVTPCGQPLGRGVHPGPVKLFEHVAVVLNLGPGAKVDELELTGVHVHQDVLVLDVPVDDALAVTRRHSPHNLAEEVSRQTLLEIFLLRYKVEHVDASAGLFHHVNELIFSLEEVQQLNDTLHMLHSVKELELHGHLPAENGGPLHHIGLGHALDGNTGAV